MSAWPALVPFLSHQSTVVKDKFKDVLSSFQAKTKQISSILTSFYVAHVVQPEQPPSSPSKLQHSSLPPTVCPSTAPNKASEDVKSVVQELMLEVIGILSKSSKTQKQTEEAKRLEAENSMLKREVEKYKEQLDKLTTAYYKELHVLREQLFRKQTHGTGPESSIKFFTVEEGLTEQMCEMLNARLKEIRAGIELRLEEAQKLTQKMSEELQRYRMLTPKDYPLVTTPLSQILLKLKIIYENNRDLFWEGVAKGWGADYVEDLVEEKCGRASTVPISDLGDEIATIRREVLDVVQNQLATLKSQCWESEKRAGEAEKALYEEREKTRKLAKVHSGVEETKAAADRQFSVSEIKDLKSKLEDLQQDVTFLVDQKTVLERKARELSSDLVFYKSKLEKHMSLAADIEELEKRPRQDKKHKSVFYSALFLLAKHKILQEIFRTYEFPVVAKTGPLSAAMRSDACTITLLKDITEELGYMRNAVEETRPQTAANGCQTEHSFSTQMGEALPKPMAEVPEQLIGDADFVVSPGEKAKASTHRGMAGAAEPDSLPEKSPQGPIDREAELAELAQEIQTEMAQSKFGIRYASRNEAGRSHDRSMLLTASLGRAGRNKLHLNMDAKKYKQAIQYISSKNKEELADYLSWKRVESMGVKYIRKLCYLGLWNDAQEKSDKTAKMTSELQSKRSCQWNKVLSATQLLNENAESAKSKSAAENAPELALQRGLTEYPKINISPPTKAKGLTQEQIMEQWQGLVSRKCARVTRMAAQRNEYTKFKRQKTTPHAQGERGRSAEGRSRLKDVSPASNILKAGFTNERIKRANKLNRTACEEAWGIIGKQ